MFAKAKLTRFNEEILSCAPPPTAYKPKLLHTIPSVSFDRSPRFNRSVEAPRQRLAPGTASEVTSRHRVRGHLQAPCQRSRSHSPARVSGQTDIGRTMAQLEKKKAEIVKEINYTKMYTLRLKTFNDMLMKSSLASSEEDDRLYLQELEREQQDVEEMAGREWVESHRLHSTLNAFHEARLEWQLEAANHNFKEELERELGWSACGVKEKIVCEKKLEAGNCDIEKLLEEEVYLQKEEERQWKNLKELEDKMAKLNLSISCSGASQRLLTDNYFSAAHKI